MLHGDGDEADLEGIDVTKCFDEMGYEETHNDLWDVTIKNDKFALMAKLDETIRAKINTPVGVTEDFKLERLILQGSVNAPLKCSVQFETLNNDCMKRDAGSVLYKYKGIIFIPPLQMVDDVLMISRCGIETIEANSILNYKMESKKLRLSKDKCYHMHISKNGSKCPSELKVHNFPMEKVDSALYLGDLITASGSVDETIKARELKAIGIRSQIMSILKNASL